jgi:hypothetical protein
MHSIGTAERHNAVALPAVEDEDVRANLPRAF